MSPPTTRDSNAAHAMAPNEGSADVVVQRENAVDPPAAVMVASDDDVMRSIKRVTREHRDLLAALAR